MIIGCNQSYFSNLSGIVEEKANLKPQLWGENPPDFSYGKKKAGEKNYKRLTWNLVPRRSPPWPENYQEGRSRRNGVRTVECLEEKSSWNLDENTVTKNFARQ